MNNNVKCIKLIILSVIALSMVACSNNSELNSNNNNETTKVIESVNVKDDNKSDKKRISIEELDTDEIEKMLNFNYNPNLTISDNNKKIIKFYYKTLFEILNNVGYFWNNEATDEQYIKFQDLFTLNRRLIGLGSTNLDIHRTDQIDFSNDNYENAIDREPSGIGDSLYIMGDDLCITMLMIFWGNPEKSYNKNIQMAIARLDYLCPITFTPNVNFDVGIIDTYNYYKREAPILLQNEIDEKYKKDFNENDHYIYNLNDIKISVENCKWKNSKGNYVYRRNNIKCKKKVQTGGQFWVDFACSVDSITDVTISDDKLSFAVNYTYFLTDVTSENGGLLRYNNDLTNDFIKRLNKKDYFDKVDIDISYKSSNGIFYIKDYSDCNIDNYFLFEKAGIYREDINLDKEKVSLSFVDFQDENKVVVPIKYSFDINKLMNKGNIVISLGYDGRLNVINTELY